MILVYKSNPRGILSILRHYSLSLLYPLLILFLEAFTELGTMDVKIPLAASESEEGLLRKYKTVSY